MSGLTFDAGGLIAAPLPSVPVPEVDAEGEAAAPPVPGTGDVGEGGSGAAEGGDGAIAGAAGDG